MLIGMAHREQFPALTAREPRKKFLSNRVLDGLMDEVRFFTRALTAEEIKAAFAANAPIVWIKTETQSQLTLRLESQRQP
jgi:hypothetical protein